MKYCESCKLNVNGNNQTCPLCKNELGEGENTSDVFPVIPSIYEEQNIVFKILIFISILGSSISLIINYIVNDSLSWSLLVIAGVLFFWVDLVTSIYKKSSPNAIIFNQVLILSAGCIIYDYLTGFTLWSITYALPFLCIVAISEMFIASLILKYSVNNYIIYLLATCIIGIMQIIFVFAGLISVAWPSVVCFILSIVMISIILIFCNKKCRRELKRKFHI